MTEKQLEDARKAIEELTQIQAQIDQFSRHEKSIVPENGRPPAFQLIVQDGMACVLTNNNYRALSITDDYAYRSLLTSVVISCQIQVAKLRETIRKTDVCDLCEPE